MSRIRLHKHLFTSLLMHAIISALLKWHLLKSTHNRSASDDRSEFSRVHGYSVVTGTGSSTSSSVSPPSSTDSFNLPSLCLVLSVLLRYFRSVNYLWMFNEALYLHQLIKHAFSQPSLRPLIILAYSLPFITTTSYIFARSMTPFSLEPAFVKEAVAESGGPHQTEYNHLYNSHAQLVDSIYSAQLVGLTDQIVDKSTPSNSHQPLPSSFALTDDLQLNDRVHQALSSLIRSSPAIRQHLKLLSSNVESKHQHYHHETKQESLQSPSFEPDSWLSDLLAGESGANSYQHMASAQRLVADDDSETSNSETKLEETSVLESLDALEDVNPLVEEDNCWLMPSYESWHEWIINVPNLAILIVSRANTFHYIFTYYLDLKANTHINDTISCNDSISVICSILNLA